jgi:hypothetical protein
MSERVSAAGTRWREVVLWIAAVALMLGTAYYQRRTGPSYPERGHFEVAGQWYRYRLVRSALTSEGARVAIPAPVAGANATLLYRRYPTDDEFASVPMTAEGGELVGRLPAQPPAGKLEYLITLAAPEGEQVIPGSGETVIVRFKDRVPIYVLGPHIFMMFISVLLGMRTGLAALFAPAPMRRLAWLTLAGMTLGGMILGPIAQEYAFGAYWTGFPFDYDLTDNKVLLMWLVWVVACAVIGLRARRDARRERLAVAIAALVMLVVYVIPHSAQGTELDYGLYEQGVPASDALRSGRRG